MNIQKYVVITAISLVLCLAFQSWVVVTHTAHIETVALPVALRDTNTPTLRSAAIPGNPNPLDTAAPLTVANNTFVGVNIDTPQYRLDVNGLSTGNPIRLRGLLQGASTDSLISSKDGVLRRISVGSVGGSGQNWSQIGNTGTNPTTNFIGTTDANDLVFKTNNIEKMRVASNGDISLGSTNAKIIYPQVKSLTLAAQGIRIAFINVSKQSSTKILLNSSENGYHEIIELLIQRDWNQSLSEQPVIFRSGYKTHEHSHDVGFSADSLGNIYIEKVLYSTYRIISISRIEQLYGSCTVLDGLLTNTGILGDNSIYFSNYLYKNGSYLYLNNAVAGITNFGINTNSPTERLAIGAGNVLVGNTFGYRIANSSGGNLVGLSLDATNKWSAFNNSMYVDATGSVGISTTTPQYKLDVNGDVSGTVISAKGNTPIPNQVGGQTFFTGGYSTPVSGRMIFGDGTGWKYNLSKRIGGVTTDLFSFMDNGNVGIGTTSPTSSLHIQNGKIAVGTPDIGGSVGASLSDSELRFRTTANYYAGLKMLDSYEVSAWDFNNNVAGGFNGNYFKGNSLFSASSFQVASLSGSQFKIGSNTVNYGGTPLRAESWVQSVNIAEFIGTNGGNVAILKANGTVGIGTATPVSKLHVQEAVGGQETAITVDNFGTPTTGTRAAFNVAEAGRAVLTMRYNRDYSGLAQLGTLTGTDPLAILIGNVEKMRVASNGTVGIGTTTPTEKLEVVGRVKAQNLRLSSIPVFENDSAAASGGLVQGDVYRNSVGQLFIKL